MPIVNNEEGKWDCVRLGFMTLRQDFRLANHWKGYLTGGNFSDDRMGVAAGVGYFSANGRWTVEGEGGITGSSHFYGSKWEMHENTVVARGFGYLSRDLSHIHRKFACRQP